MEKTFKNFLRLENKQWLIDALIKKDQKFISFIHLPSICSSS